jgi:thiamine biosynthesis lipoprotein
MSDVAVQAERAFRAMGSDAHVLVWSGPDCPVAPEDLLDVAEAEIAHLEGLWSRFRPDSDISRLNTAGGRPVAIAEETAALLELCRVATARTGGRFDPLVLPELIDAGYDRSFELVAASDDDRHRRRAPARAHRWRRAPERKTDPDLAPVAPDVVRAARPTDGRPSMSRDMTNDLITGTAALGAGAAIDVGGIGKGRAADLVAAALVRLGATAACVNLGGDLRVTGTVPGGTGLLVAIEDPFGGEDLAVWSVHDGAVATSSCLRRRWQRDGEDRHHLIDPTTGRPASTDVVACSVVAPTGAWADVLAKAVLLAPEDDAAALLADSGAAALVIHGGGRITTLGTPPSVAGIGAPDPT